MNALDHQRTRVPVLIALSLLFVAGCSSTPKRPAPAAAPPQPPVATNADVVIALRALGFDVEEQARGVVIFLPAVYLFDFGSSDLQKPAQVKLGELAEYLKLPAVVDRRLALEGHTDSVGSEASNQTLSERRAAVVQQELLTGGVAAGRMTALGFGETKPVAPNELPNGTDNPEGRAKNRRVEIVILTPP